MNLKLKYVLIITAQSIIPFTMLICGPYVGLRPNNTGRVVQLVGGVLIIVGLGLFQYFLGYCREKQIRETFAAIRARGGLYDTPYDMPMPPK